MVFVTVISEEHISLMQILIHVCYLTEILILLDSGSVGTLVKDLLVATYTLPTQSCESVTYSMADGSPMQSSTMVSQLAWFLQGHTFTYDARSAGSLT